MKHVSILHVFFIGSLTVGWSLGVSSEIPAKTGTSWWLAANVADNSVFEKHLATIEDSIGQTSQFHHLTGSDCQVINLQKVITRIKHQAATEDTLVFLFRSQITKPSDSNQIYFSVADDQLISSRQINQWLKGINSIVLLDCFTVDANLEAFYANRQLLGTAAIVSIFGQPLTETSNLNVVSRLASILSGTFVGSPKVDLNDNRQLALDEVYDALASGFLHPGIFVPTGDLEMVLMKLPAMIKIWGQPDEVSIFVNGRKIGVTELRLTEDLHRLTGNVELRKAGYNLQQLSLNAISKQLGQQNSITYRLEPISVQGQISWSEVETTGPVAGSVEVKILGTPYQQTMSGISQYTFNRWDQGELEADKPYTLVARGNQRYYAEANFIYDGFESIRVDLKLKQKTWFQIAQIQYDLALYEDAIQAFQNGIEDSLEFPPLSRPFTKMLYDSFLKTLNQVDVPATYLAAMAELAGRQKLPTVAKAYWRETLNNAENGSLVYKLAKQKLRDFYLIYYYMIAGVTLIFLLIIGGIVYRRQENKGRIHV